MTMTSTLTLNNSLSERMRDCLAEQPRMIAFPQGPKIRVTLTSEAAHLSLSDCFEVCLAEHIEKNQWRAFSLFLKEYLQKKHAEIPLPLPLSPFRKEVLSTLQKIPFGELISYGELAQLAGHPKAARAVGTTCHLNRYPLFIPCHRVISSNGKIGGFAGDLEIKKRLLEFEQRSTT